MVAAAETQNKSASKQAMGLAFELETVLFGSRHLLFEAVKGALAEKNINVSRELFSRYCLHPMPSNFIPQLVAATDKRLSSDAFIKDAERRYLKAILHERAAPIADITTLLRQAQEAGVSLGAITFLDSDDARTLANRAGLPEDAPLHVCRETGHETPRSDCWLRLAKKMGCQPRQILAITSAASATRSAIITGMHVIVAPDTFTEHEDFTGADMVLEDSRSLTWVEASTILNPRTFR